MTTTDVLVFAAREDPRPEKVEEEEEVVVVVVAVVVAVMRSRCRLGGFGCKEWRPSLLRVVVLLLGRLTAGSMVETAKSYRYITSQTLETQK